MGTERISWKERHRRQSEVRWLSPIGFQSDSSRFEVADDTLRPTNLHARVQGRPNQIYPLLFRDYLRAHPTAAAAYGVVKIQLAQLLPDDPDVYYAIKNPVCDVITGAAQEWAKLIGWEMEPSVPPMDWS